MATYLAGKLKSPQTDQYTGQLRNELRTTNQHKKSFKKFTFNQLPRFWQDWRHFWRENGEIAQ